jgi:8-oxo-dGTP pyrophosphatase MutT (NUDIX family)
MEREGKEETGADIEVLQYIWTIVEQSKSGKVIQHNRWFTAKVVRLWTAELTEEEIERKFELHWMDMDKAIELMKKNEPITYRWSFMQARDLQFLQIAKEFLHI